MIVMIGFFTGLRLAEIASLRWEMFDQTFSSVKFLGKGNKWATVGLPAQLSDVLKAWRLESPSASVVLPAMHATNAWGKDGRSLLNWQRPLRDSGVAYAVRIAGERVNITVRPHDMRRTYAGLMESQGTSIKDISRAMRHSNVGTTDRYLDQSPLRSKAVTSGFTLNLGES